MPADVQDTASAPSRPGRRWLVLLAAVLVSALTARLGVWQLDRAAQKEAQHQQVLQRSQLPVLAMADLARDVTQAASQHSRRVTLTGRWLPQGTVYLENRQMRAHAGFYVVTPLLLASGDAVLVQRGWLPRDLLDRTLVPAVATPGDTPVTVHGYIAPPPSRLYDFDGAASGPIRQNLDLDAEARTLGLALRPLSVMQTGVDDPPAEPVSAAHPTLLRDWPVPSAGIEKHHGYAAQWFVLSALSVALYVWFQILRPRLARRAQRS